MQWILVLPQVWKPPDSGTEEPVCEAHTHCAEPCKTKAKTSMKSWDTRQGCCSQPVPAQGNSSSAAAQSQGHQHRQCVPAHTTATSLKAAICYQSPQEWHIQCSPYQRLLEKYGLLLPPKSATMQWVLAGNCLDLTGLHILYTWWTPWRAWGINRHAAELNSQFS